jgi:recombination protein RecR
MLPSKVLEDAVNEFMKLPGIGRKTALRLVLHLLKSEKADTERFGDTMIRLCNEIKYCRQCHNISETELCNICCDHRRDTSLICLVEDIRDVLAIENTGQYRGVYHLLGGIISPMEGIGPADLHVESLIERVRTGNVNEVIMALRTTMEGDTTIFYISKRLREFNVSISSLARGVAIGDELEYTDEVTLGRSILNRLPYDLKTG